ncbi:alpha-glycosidase [Gorillibacterium timonense]|uniref:alpha-glycosidase n=1 Tax=Gorillibacterium timonense TaxID=1689269 RepID=UPI00071C43A2|nr:alpha-glycosidase [Gorillibacterium timonense]
MFKEAIFHTPKSNYAYAYDNNTLHISLKSKKGDLTNVNLLYGDPYYWADGEQVMEKMAMSLSGTDDLFDYWFAAISIPVKRFSYLFEVSDGQETLIYGERGFTAEKARNRIFRFPYLNETDVFKAPDWVKRTIWYQIYPDRFANGNPEGKTGKLSEWGTESLPGAVFGGDLQGIIDHLDHLVELGVNGIYLTPIFKSPSDHKYDTIDYFEIDPQFGDKETFRQLVDACHERGIHIILDAVFNHSGFLFEKFQHVLTHKGQSPYVNHFHIQELPEEGDPVYETFAYVKEMPKLNTENPEMKQYLLDVAKYWVEEFGTDGWRLDVANEVDHAFWRSFRQAVREANPDTYIIGEVAHDANAWLQGDQFDAVMNYPFTEMVVDFIAKNRINAEQYANEVVKQLHNHSANANEVAFNLLGSHDTPRILSVCGDDKDKLRLAFLLLLTYTGAPTIYYGDEIGLDGDGGDFSYYRKCMEWDKEKQDRNLFAFMQKLIYLRKNVKPLYASSQLSILEADGDANYLVFSRSYEKETVLVALNNGNRPVTIPWPANVAGKHAVDLLTNEVLHLSPDAELTLQPMQYSLVHVVS